MPHRHAIDVPESIHVHAPALRAEAGAGRFASNDIALAKSSSFAD